MAKPSSSGLGLHTPRPSATRSSCPSTRSSVGSTPGPYLSSAPASNSKLPLASSSNAAKVVAKCLAYDDVDATLPAAAAPQEQDDLHEPLLLLELPDPDVSGDAAFTAPADSCVTEVEVEVASRAGSISVSVSPDDEDRAASLPEEMSVVLAELRGARGLSPRSRRLLSALAETASFELATARRLRRDAFWGKVRVAVLAATFATVAAIDVALAAYLYACRVNGRYHVLPPT